MAIQKRCIIFLFSHFVPKTRLSFAVYVNIIIPGCTLSRFTVQCCKGTSPFFIKCRAPQNIIHELNKFTSVKYKISHTKQSKTKLQKSQNNINNNQMNTRNSLSCALSWNRTWLVLVLWDNNQMRKKV